MSNKTLATINVICICFPMIMGAFIDPDSANQIIVGLFGLLMIFFGIWTSLRLAKQPD